MANTSKPSGASATGLNFDPFHQARVKLTLWYMAIILVIVTVFSISFYTATTQQLRRSYRENVRGELIQEENFFDDACERLAWLLVMIDGAVLLVAAFASYGFAGYTLKPIKLAMEGQKRFVADASHELRTPLAVMRTDIEVLQRQKTELPAAVQKTLASLLEEIGNLTRLSHQLLELSQAEGRDFSSGFTPVDLQQVLSKTVDRFQGLAHSSKIGLALAESGPVHILGSRHFLEHAFANVIENAIKYNKPKGRVDVSLAVKDNQADVRIADTGVGITEKDLPFIFERFYQGDQSKHGQGTGLGLSIVKAIVDAHGGHLAVQSALGQGTVFLISLPAQKKYKITA